ncbi:hypothetical protein GGQ72_004621, partial [Rhizobium rhizoryzae]|nr:hypothetical protein [Rhizobium rhizoryzae]
MNSNVDLCPVCEKPLNPDDLCASDIEIGLCHASCLEGSPVVDLDTGNEIPDARMATFYHIEVTDPSPQTHVKGETRTRFHIEWIAGARPPVHPHPMTGRTT